MYAEVIPVRRMPRSLQYLDYGIPEELKNDIKIGQLVRLPLRGKEIFGVIRKIKDAPEKNPDKIKNISGLISIQPFISPNQLDFLEEMSEFYKTPLGFIIKTNLPPLKPRRLKNLKIKLPASQNSDKKFELWKPSFYLHKDDAEKEKIIDELIPEKGQALILVPETDAVTELEKNILKKFPDETASFSGTKSEKELFEIWLKIWSGQKRIVVGTRAALFLPWTKLQKIILTDENNSNYKSWDMAPRYHTRDAVMLLAKHHGAEVSLLAHTPSVETYFFTEHKVYGGSSKIPVLTPRPKITNMKEERMAGNRSVLSEEAAEKIQNIKGGDVFLYINRLGDYCQIMCKDCGERLLCERCGRALIFVKDKNILRCGSCGVTKQMVNSCQKCGGLNFKNFGLGARAAEEEIKNNFSKTGKEIIRIDSDSEADKTIKSDTDKIIIGTKLAWSKINWKKIRLMVFLDADITLYIPEYKAGEELWNDIRDASYRLNNDANFYLQTTKPEHNTYSSLARPSDFYVQELGERRILGYPPFAYLLKMFYGATTPGMAQNEAEKATTSLMALTSGQFGGRILGPLDPIPSYSKGLYWKIILAKIPYSGYKKGVKLLLSGLDGAWRADPNPNTILNI